MTPAGARRVARETALQPFANAAKALNEDWHTHYDAKQVERWSLYISRKLEAARDAEVLASECGRRPTGPENPPELLVLGVDGGRVQMNEVNPETGSRWREDKVVSVTSYVAGDGAEKKPCPLVTTVAATMQEAEPFGKLARVEFERRGLHQAKVVIALADCGRWIDPLLEREVPNLTQRIADWSHAEEHLYDCARAVHGSNQVLTESLAAPLADWLWYGRVEEVVARIAELSAQLGVPQDEDGPQHPRRVLANNVGYFERNKKHMNYPEYRRRGWPIGSGNVEASVKQFNKRVKGTEQFWSEPGAEAVLCLRALWLSQDDRWNQYWRTRPAYIKLAA